MTAYVEACYRDQGYALEDLACGDSYAYVDACYWEAGYAINDDLCVELDANALMAGFVFDRTVQDAPLTLTRVSTTAAHIRRDTGRMYVVDPGTGAIMQFDGDNVNRLPFEWKSKTFVMPKPTNFSFAQVLLDDISSEFSAAIQEAIEANADLWASGAWAAALNDVEANEFEVNGSAMTNVPTLDPVYTTLYVYADKVLVHTINVLTEKLHRLPGGFRAMRWEVEVIGNKGVRRITLATSATEIAAQ
jgi:hypothetical protein